MKTSTMGKAVWGAAVALSLSWPAPGIVAGRRAAERGKMDRAVGQRLDANDVQQASTRVNTDRIAATRNKVAGPSAHERATRGR